MKESLVAAINKQINAELYSSYLYLAMSADLEEKSLKGMASWMQIQVQEEASHAMKFYHYLQERGARIELQAIDAPQTTWPSVQAIFDATCEHEAVVTGLINDLVDLAIAERDHAAAAFLQWFVTEQVEEEASAKEIADQLRLAGDHAGALFMMDRELGTRTFTPPAAE